MIFPYSPFKFTGIYVVHQLLGYSILHPTSIHSISPINIGFSAILLHHLSQRISINICISVTTIANYWFFSYLNRLSFFQELLIIDILGLDRLVHINICFLMLWLLLLAPILIIAWILRMHHFDRLLIKFNLLLLLHIFHILLTSHISWHIIGNRLWLCHHRLLCWDCWNRLF